MRALDLEAEGRLEFTEQDEDAATYAEKVGPSERRLDPARPAEQLARTVRALTPHVGAYLELRRRQAARGAARPPRRRQRRDRRDASRVGRALARLRPLRAEAGSRAAPRRQADAGRRLPARPPAAAAMSEVSAARALAYAGDPRDVRGRRLHRAAFREAAEEAGLSARDRAQAQRLAYGAVQRRGTSDAAIELLAGRSTRLLDPPVLAGLRLGLYELLFADATPDHAAVDQAVELVKRAGAAHAAGLVNAVLRRAARERAGLVDSLLGDDSTPAAAAVAHSAPLWLAEMWWRELGADVARAAARRLQRACRGERDSRCYRPRSGRGACRAARVGRRGASAGRRMAAGRAGDDRDRRADRRRGAGSVEEGELTPQSRGSAAVVEVLDPQEGEHVLDLCAGPGIKTGQIAARMAIAARSISVELEPVGRAESGRPGAAAGTAQRHRDRGRRGRDGDGARLRPRPARRALLGPRRARLAPRRPLAQVAEDDRAAGRGPARGAAAGGRRALRPGGVLVYATCTISRRENEDQVAALLAASRGGEVPPLEVEDLGERSPGLASPLDPRCLQLRPDRDRTTGFFICRLRAA